MYTNKDSYKPVPFSMELGLVIDNFMGKDIGTRALENFFILSLHCFDVCYFISLKFSHSDYFVLEKPLLEKYYTV